MPCLAFPRQAIALALAHLTEKYADSKAFERLFFFFLSETLD
ncbi:hypothetical protein X767_03535 [Mesorhizobium sp. LSJC264A00]|nr:hypothetical protein X767_03535 [Mesorhizobium sp. LSJC264A00]